MGASRMKRSNGNSESAKEKVLILLMCHSLSVLSVGTKFPTIAHSLYDE